MSYFQNPFNQSFVGSLVLGETTLSQKFQVPANSGRNSWEVCGFKTGPYNMSGRSYYSDTDYIERNKLLICFKLNNTWSTMTCILDTESEDNTHVTAKEVVNALNKNEQFSTVFDARVGNLEFYDESLQRIVITLNKNYKHKADFYIANGGAEEVIRFNHKAPVVDIPSYFNRETVENKNKFENSTGMLISLNNLFIKDDVPSIDLFVVKEAVNYINDKKLNLPDEPKNDWELIKGAGGIFKTVYNKGAGETEKINVQIQCSTGAKAGDLTKKIITHLDGEGNVVAIFEIPYVLQEEDIKYPSEFN